MTSNSNNSEKNISDMILPPLSPFQPPAPDKNQFPPIDFGPDSLPPPPPQNKISNKFSSKSPAESEINNFFSDINKIN